MLLAAINLAVFLGLRSVLTHSPPCFVTGQNFPRVSLVRVLSCL